ncbi:monovalent cation/H(+) antiporter subunit G [Enteractinococcus helveticum]|uniref:monovalent cation/H(+) antiporter subunit G n=1 Tax=Enteractinococcus helveticum TaxID=1837282 RepID=UPI00082A8659|nr:monovalent cation/H(+) antiporter subunit G [Enteractinococcus helveticum]
MDLSAIADVIGNVMAVVGVLVISLAAVGLFRFTDTYQRISAVGTAAGVGITLIVAGVFLIEPTWGNLIKVIIIIFLQLATSSIGTMAIARAAYLTGTKMTPGYFDHLADDQVHPEDGVKPDVDVPLEDPDDDARPNSTDDDTVLGAS